MLVDLEKIWREIVVVDMVGPMEFDPYGWVCAMELRGSFKQWQVIAYASTAAPRQRMFHGEFSPFDKR
jgi:hypothetical protein